MKKGRNNDIESHGKNLLYNLMTVKYPGSEGLHICRTELKKDNQSSIREIGIEI